MKPDTSLLYFRIAPLVPIPSHINPVLIFLNQLLNTHFNIILPSVSWSPMA